MTATRQCACGTWLYPNDRSCPGCGASTAVVAVTRPGAAGWSAPGWYPAPDGSPYLRRWSGTAWTPEIAALPVVTAPSVTYVPVRTNHVLHLLLTIFTAGLWAPVWLIVSLSNLGRQRGQVTRPL